MELHKNWSFSNTPKLPSALMDVTSFWESFDLGGVQRDLVRDAEEISKKRDGMNDWVVVVGGGASICAS